jgi:phosphate transport system substrate-binding protein
MTNTGIYRTSTCGISRRLLVTVVTGSASLAMLFLSPIGTTCWAQDLKATGSVALHGAGSTFAAPLYRKWIEEYGVAHPNVSIAYDSVGSGEGVKRFITDSVDFAGSDEILTAAEAAKAREGTLMVPVTAGMIALAYNIPGVNSEIKLPRDVYVDIFAGKIRQWDDPRIKAANPGINFPHIDIATVARQDSSGTTAAFTHHLAAIPAWRAAGMGVGKLIDWPKGTMLAPGNEGVAGKIKISDGSIGYVEYWFAQRLGLRMAAVQNKAGEFITPTANAGQLALSGRVAQVKELDASVADPANPGAYPITTYSWMFLYPRYSDRAKAVALRDFAEWGLTRGQNYGAQLGYLPLSADVVAIGTQALGGLTQ